MRIGIDIDDTISNTNETLIEYAKVFDKIYKSGKGIRNICSYKLYEIFYWEEEDEDKFLSLFLDDILRWVPVKSDAKDIINKLHDEGNYICIVTKRNSEFLSNPEYISKYWLDVNGIYYDKIIVKSNKKGETCAQENLSILIDDLPKNCMNAKDNGIRPLLFNGYHNQDCNDFERVNDWNEVYNIIKEVE